jgi:hypothetical protein
MAILFLFKLIKAKGTLSIVDQDLLKWNLSYESKYYAISIEEYEYGEGTSTTDFPKFEVVGFL